MTEPRFRNTSTINPVRASVPSLPRGSAFPEFQKLLQSFVDAEQDKLDKETVIQSRIAGATAGNDPLFQPTRGTTLAEQAFDKAGLHVASNRAISNVETVLKTLSSDPTLNADPDALAEKALAEVGRIGANLPAEIQPDFEIVSKKAIGSMVSNAKVRQYELRIEAMGATFVEAESALLRQMSNAAMNGHMETALVFKGKYTDLIAANGPSTGMEFNGQEIAGNNILKAEEVVKKSAMATKAFTTATMVGEFRRVPYDRKMEWLHEVEGGEGLGAYLAGVMSAEEKNELISSLYTEVGRAAAERSREREEREFNRKQNARRAGIAFLMNPTPENLERYGKFGEPGTYNTLKSALEDQEFGDDENVVHDLGLQLFKGTLTSSDILDHVGNGLSVKTAQEFYTKVENQADHGFVKWSDWEESVRRVEDDFPVARNMLGFITGGAENEKIQNRIRTRLYDTVRDEYELWEAGQGEKPNILRHYQLISEAEKKRVKAEKEAANKHNQIVGVPLKYQANPETLLEDVANGTINPEKIPDMINKLINGHKSGIIVIRPEVLKSLEEKINDKDWYMKLLELW